ncbi:MAG: hypothetical protein E5X67_34390 [Mesorhizobium sp.]|uniref:hypothetical protein n=1 Tax=Mesorhizobium sp. TaxID=1871066 RepID=UPI00121F89DB|nr:hypothetical protein [Mesorhizobium sp.]TIP23202.1 MAG: hypothetical protein E5X67_34390 [Mesorhizobium sp.]
MLLGVAAILAATPAVAHADENCVQLDFFLTGKWAPVFEISKWASRHPALDFGKMRVSLEPDGVAVYEDRLNNREVKSSWEVRLNSVGLERLCLPNNPFDPDLECSAIYKSANPDGPGALISFESQCADGDFGFEVFVGVEQTKPEDPLPSPDKSSSPATDEAGTSQQEEEDKDSADDAQVSSEVPRCNSPEVKDTISSLLASTRLDGEQLLAFTTVGRPKLTYTIKAVRTEGELLNGYSCSAIATAAIDTSSNAQPNNQMAVLMLRSQGLLGDKNIDYSVKMMDDGQIMVNLEP